MEGTYFEKFLTILTKLKYPHINIYAKKDIISVFNTENRKLLIGWILKTILQTSELDEKTDISVITEYLCNLGFCDEKQANGFMQNSLSFEKQIVIFNKLFHWVEFRWRSSNNQKPTTSLTLEELCIEDFNVMPMETSSDKTITHTKNEKTAEYSKINEIQISETVKSLESFVNHLDVSTIKNKCPDRRKLSSEVIDSMSNNLENINKLLRHADNCKILNDCIALIK